MTLVNKFNVNREQVTLDADIIENMSANDVSYNASTQYNEKTVGDKLSELDLKIGGTIEDYTNINKISGYISSTGRAQLNAYEYWITDRIKLSKGYRIHVLANIASNDFALVSIWNDNDDIETGKTVEPVNVLELSKQGDNDYTYTAENDMYVRVCAGTIQTISVYSINKIEKLNHEVESINAEIGNLEDLQTLEKSNIVAAINEVKQSGGGSDEKDYTEIDKIYGYISSSGRAELSGETYKITNIIELTKGDKITILSSSLNSGFALLSKWDTDTIETGATCGNDNVLVLTIKEENEYTYTAEYDEKIRVCSVSFVSIIVKSRSDIDTIKDDVEQLKKDIHNPLKGKTIYVEGDSIAYGQRNKQGDNYVSWADYVAENNEMILTKAAVSGSKISDGTPSIQQRLNKIADADYIIISGGYNDYAQDVTFGTLSNSIGRQSDSDLTVDGDNLDLNTYYGGLERIIRNIMINHPHSKLGFVLTHKVANTWITPLGSNKTHTFKEYHDATIEVLEKYGIPCCDMTKYMNVLYNNPSVFVDEQMVHPNEFGYKKYYVPAIEAWLKSF